MTGYDGLHPTFAERLRQLNDTCGTFIVSGRRSSGEQQALYDLYLAGQGNPANPPGSSNHEATPWGDATGLAADLGGDLVTANASAAEFNLHFPIASTEPWHVQPVEVPFAYYTGVPAELGDVPTGRPGLLCLNAKGQAVVECQQRLNVHGIPCSVDGWFGEETKDSVVTVQTGAGLEADGVVGKDTWALLDSEPADAEPPPPPLPTAGRTLVNALRLSSQGSAMIAELEGRINTLYNDPANHCTIGIGHLVHEGPIDGCEAEAPFANGLSDEEVYRLFLEKDAPIYEEQVRRLITVPLFPSEFDALVSFTYNLGGGALEESTLREVLNAGNYAQAAEEFKRWVFAGGQVSDGLVARREREAQIFRSQWV